jgi:hypothetical protein
MTKLKLSSTKSGEYLTQRTKINMLAYISQFVCSQFARFLSSKGEKIHLKYSHVHILLLKSSLYTVCVRISEARIHELKLCKQ